MKSEEKDRIWESERDAIAKKQFSLIWRLKMVQQIRTDQVKREKKCKQAKTSDAFEHMV